MVLRRDPDGRARLANTPELDEGVRPVLLPASVLPLLLGMAASSLSPASIAAPQPAAPQIDRSSVRMAKGTLYFRASRPLLPATLTSETIQVVSLQEGKAASWQEHPLLSDTLTVDNDGQVSCEIEQGSWSGGPVVRLLLRGSGAAVILSQDHVPLCGALGDPAAAPGQGRDFVDFVRLE
jgi:hypothetical protein